MDPAPAQTRAQRPSLWCRPANALREKGPHVHVKGLLLSEGALVFPHLILFSPVQVFPGDRLGLSTERHTYLDTSQSRTNRDGWSLYLYIGSSPRDVNRCSTKNRKEKGKGSLVILGAGNAGFKQAIRNSPGHFRS